MESALNSRQRSAIRDEAAEWLLVRKAGLDPERARQFARWLASSPEHLAEYQAMESLDRDLPLALDSAASADELILRVRSAQDDDDTVVPFVGNGRARRAARHNHPWALAASFAFVAVAVAMLWPKVKEMAAPQAWERTYTSELGKVGSPQRLEDGSTLTLDTDSQLVVRYDETGRHVRLQRGRARFEVVHDEFRPFVVWAGPARVEDVGTKFDVYRMPGDVTRVTVLEGRVEVSRDSSDGISGTRQLGANEQIDVVNFQPLGEPVQVDAIRAMSWTSGEIRFEGVSVQEAAAEVERYSAKRIVVESPALRSETIHYTFRTGDVGAFLAFLRDPRGLGAQVTEESERIVVTSP